MHFGSRGPSEVLSVRLGYVTEMHWRRRPGKTPYKDKTNVHLVWPWSLFFRWIRHIFSVQKPLSLSCLIQLVWKKNYYRKRTSLWISRKIWNWRYYGLRGRNNQNLFHLGNFFCDTPIKMRQMCVLIYRMQRVTDISFRNVSSSFLTFPVQSFWSMYTDQACD